MPESLHAACKRAEFASRAASFALHKALAWRPSVLYEVAVQQDPKPRSLTLRACQGLDAAKAAALRAAFGEQPARGTGSGQGTECPLASSPRAGRAGRGLRKRAPPCVGPDPEEAAEEGAPPPAAADSAGAQPCAPAKPSALETEALPPARKPSGGAGAAGKRAAGANSEGSERAAEAGADAGAVVDSDEDDDFLPRARSQVSSTPWSWLDRVKQCSHKPK